MEKLANINVAQMKEDIKKLNEEQRFLKNQRKTDKIVGERKMDPHKAAEQHRYNRWILRCMYAAYGIARGKSLSEIENHYPQENHPLMKEQWKIDEILKKYEKKVKVEEGVI